MPTHLRSARNRSVRDCAGVTNQSALVKDVVKHYDIPYKIAMEFVDDLHRAIVDELLADHSVYLPRFGWFYLWKAGKVRNYTRLDGTKIRKKQRPRLAFRATHPVQKLIREQADGRLKPKKK